MRRLRKHQPGTGSSRVSQRCSGSRPRGWRRIHRVSTGTVGKIPRRCSAARIPPARQIDVVGGRPIARVFLLGGGTNEAAAQQEMQTRLQVGEVRHRHQQPASGPQHTMELGDHAGLFVEGQMFEDVEAEEPIEDAAS